MSTKKSNNGLLLLALGGAFVYWKFFYISEGDKAAAKAYFVNRGMTYTDADITNLIKQHGKAWVAANQVPALSSSPVVLPIYSNPGSSVPVQSIVDAPPSGLADSFNDFMDNLV